MHEPTKALRRCARLASILLVLALMAPSPAPAQDAGSGRLAAALGRLDGLAAETLQRTGIPGLAIAVVSHDQAVYLKGFGVREAGTGQAVDADTVFQLASV